MEERGEILHLDCSKKQMGSREGGIQTPEGGRDGSQPQEEDHREMNARRSIEPHEAVGLKVFC